MSNHCFLCGEPNALTIEHIIPQAIGGKLKPVLYCDRCNSTIGHEVDVEISKQFGWVGTVLNIKRERGKPPPFEVEDLTSGTALICDGESLRRKDPIVKLIKSANGKKLDYVDVTARSKEELQKRRCSIEKRYDVAGGGKTFIEDHPGPTHTKHDIEIDNALLRRAVSKIAYGFLCTKLPKDDILSQAFEEVRAYIKTGREPALACANFIHTGFMTDGVRPLHKVHVALNRREKLVVGYVSLFGIYRFTVLLAENYESRLEWASLDYTFDPVRREEVVGNDRFRAPELNRENILHPKQSEEFVQGELDRGYKIIESYNDQFKCVDGVPESEEIKGQL